MSEVAERSGVGILREIREIKREAREERKEMLSRIDGVAADVVALRVDVSALKVKTGITGALAGGIAGTATAVIRHFLGR